MGKYTIYRVGRNKSVVSTHKSKLEAVLALQEICNSLGGDYKMTAPVEHWKVNSKYGVFSETKHTYFIINDW